MSKSFGAPYWLVPQGTRPVHYMDNPGLLGRDAIAHVRLSAEIVMR